MNEKEIIDLKKFKTWLKISMDIGKAKTFENWRTFALIDAILSYDKYPETFYIKDILDFLDVNDNKELLEYMKIHCCNAWPIEEKDMPHAEHMFTHRLLLPLKNFKGKSYLYCLREFPLCHLTYNDDFVCGLDLHAFYNDFFIGAEFHIMKIYQNFIDRVNNNDFQFSEPLNLELCPPDKDDDYFGIVLFDHNLGRYSTPYLNSDTKKDVKYDFIEEKTQKSCERYIKRVIERNKSSKDKMNNIKNELRTFLYSKWNFRFKIEDDDDIFLFDYNYIADEVIYKNIFHKIIDKKTYRPKNYTKEFNLKMSFSEFENFLRRHREYVNYDGDSIKMMIY